jgi:hypothetical protein
MGFYTVERCLRKSDQESEMGSLAAADGDKPAAKLHFENSKLWRQRAQEGGYSTDNEQHT